MPVASRLFSWLSNSNVLLRLNFTQFGLPVFIVSSGRGCTIKDLREVSLPLLLCVPPGKPVGANTSQVVENSSHTRSQIEKYADHCVCGFRILSRARKRAVKQFSGSSRALWVETQSYFTRSTEWCRHAEKGRVASHM